MKKILLFAVAAIALACSKQPESYGPTDAEKSMVKEHETWTLDSIQVIKNYKCKDESRITFRKSEGLDSWTYDFYPFSYKIPSDICFISDFTGENVCVAEDYNDDYCKYICSLEGNVIAAGYLCYYKGLFSLYGLKVGAQMQYLIHDKYTRKGNVMVLEYAPLADETKIYEYHKEYYSLVE